MAHIYERVLSLVTKPPADRRDSELEDVVPWFKKKADKLFKDIQNRELLPLGPLVDELCS